jgi:CubicO group peptidase (beta-lactamase class C family)
MRKPLFAVLLLTIGAAGAALAYAPYLPQLVTEGYPPLTWPARGHFAEIGGVDQPLALTSGDHPGQHPLPSELDRSFTETGGKALLVYRAGKLELEHYGDGVSSQTKLNSYSIAKSLVGALMFKALAEGKIESLDVPIGDLLPTTRDPALRLVSLRALLQMRSGVVFGAAGQIFGDENGAKDIEAERINPFGPKARLHFLGLSSIQTSLTAGQTDTAPFSYQNVNTALLGLVLETLYRRPLSALLGEKIWRPAGAEMAHWRQAHEGGGISAYCCIYTTARNWIRVGLFLSRNGRLGDPFLPVPLWRDFMGLNLDAAALRQGVYGYHIRHDVLNRSGEPLQGLFTYMAGMGGQLLYMMPGQDLVVFRAGERMPLLHTTLYAAWKAIGQPPPR